MVFAIVSAVLSAASFVLSILQFAEKGYLFNNAYIYASEKERLEMDKKPYYRQSAIVFLLAGFVFAAEAVEIITEAWWMAFIVGALAVAVLAYTIISSNKIEKK